MLLELNEVSKSFGGVAALTGVSFGVKQGEVFGVIGPNGAGKTTLFNLITGVFPASSGEIVFDGMSVVGIKPHRTVEMGIARTFQNIRLFGNMTALETVLTGMHCRTGSGFLSSFLKTKRQRIEEERCRGIAYEFLKLVGLEEDAEELTASGESLIGMAEEAEVEEIVATEDVDHEEARAEVDPEGDIAKADEDTPLTDALLDAGEFISSPAEGDNADLDVEKIEDDKDPFDYDSAASYDEIGDELEGSAESWGKYL